MYYYRSTVQLQFIKLLLPALITSLFVVQIHAQDTLHQKTVKNLFFRGSYQLLHSTHNTNFNGGSIDADYHLSSHFAAGLGVQYAGTHIHPDNGWILSQLRLLPVYINTIYTFLPSHKVRPYVHTEEGISFNHYNKLDTNVSALPFKVTEEGLYLSANAGVDFMLSAHIKVFTEIGYKGYKHSANDLDVNPHGFTVRAGIEL